MLAGDPYCSINDGNERISKWLKLILSYAGTFIIDLFLTHYAHIKNLKKNINIRIHLQKCVQLFLAYVTLTYDTWKLTTQCSASAGENWSNWKRKIKSCGHHHLILKISLKYQKWRHLERRTKSVDFCLKFLCYFFIRCSQQIYETFHTKY